MEENFTKRDTARAYWLFFGIVIILTIISTGLKIHVWAINGIFQTARNENTVTAFVQKINDPSTEYVVLETGRSDDIITFFPMYLPQEGQYVGLFRFNMETKTKSWPFTAWVTPKIISVTKVIGKYDQVAYEGGQTDEIGFVRNSPIRRFTVPVDNEIPHYRTISLGILPELGDQIRMYYLELFFTREKFFSLAILY